MRVLTSIVALAAIHSDAAAELIRGDVVATQTRWSGDVIVTESNIRSATGTISTVVQLGGSTGGIGMTFTHVPAPLRTGDHVEAELIGGVVTHASVAPADSETVGMYGLQRTTQSGVPLRRPDRDLAIVYDGAGTAQVPGLVEFGVLDDAFAAWMLATESCGGLRLHRTIEMSVPDALDGLETIHFRDDRWCRPATASSPELCYPHAASAVTRLAFVDDPADPEDGKILEADMDLNAVDFALAVDGVPTSDPRPAIDLLSVVTHEVGHVLGLAHDCATEDGPWPTDALGLRVPSCDAADGEHLAATMFFQVGPGDTSKRTLEDSDREAACAVVGDLPQSALITGGCSTSRTTDGAFAVLAALGALCGRRRSHDLGGTR